MLRSWTQVPRRGPSRSTAVRLLAARLTSGLMALPRVLPVASRSLFPWAYPLRLEDDRCMIQGEPDDWEQPARPADREADGGSAVSFHSALSAPGLLHVIHNAGSDLLEVVSGLGEQVTKLSDICTLVRQKQTCERLIETCYSSEVGKQFHQQLLEFSGRVYRARWGTTAFATRAMLDLERVHRWGWDLERYCSLGEHRKPVKASKEPEIVQEALTSDFFWASLRTLDALFELLRRAFEWSEGCACHTHLDWSCVAPAVRHLWARCPMRGLRLPEVAAGDFFRMFRSLQAKVASDLLVQFPVSLTSQERRHLVRNFEIGRAHLFYTFVVKLSAYSTPPLLLLACAHHDTNIAHDALRECLAADPQLHPRLSELHDEPLASQAQAYLHGEVLEDHAQLELVAAKMRFGFAVERRVEGGHALVNRRSALASHRCEAFDSYGVAHGRDPPPAGGGPWFYQGACHVLGRSAVSEVARAPARHGRTPIFGEGS